MNKQIFKTLFPFLIIYLIIMTACNQDKSTNAQEVLLFSTKFAENDHSVMGISPTDQSIIHILGIPPYARPYLSPDGQQLALWVGRTLKIVTLKTGEQIIELSNVGQTKSEHYLGNTIVWSTDSTKIAYVKDSENGVDLWLYNLLEDQEIQITNNDAVNISPVWSANSQNIAFVTNEQCKNGVDECQNEFWWDIAVYSLSTTKSEPRMITNFEQSDLMPKDSWTLLFSLLCGLKWSNDGQFIAFANDCDPFGLKWYRNAYVASVDGANHWQVTNFNQYDETATRLPNNLFTVSYEWLGDDHALWISYSEDELKEGGQAFHRSLFLSPTNLSDAFEELQYTNAPIGSDAFLSPQKQHFVWHSETQSNSVEMNRPRISKLENGTFSEIDFSTSLPFGSCNHESPHWSKSERYVAYTSQTNTGICGGPIFREHIIVDLSQATHKTIIPSNEDIELLGWTTID